MPTLLDPVLGSPGLPRLERPSDLQKAQQSFLNVLGKQLPDQAPQTPSERARDVAEQYVSIALVQPLLKQLRETSNAASPFAPTQAEKQFRALGDADLAQRIVRAKQFPLVDRLARDLLKGGGMPEVVPELAAPVDQLNLVQPNLKVTP
jgi:Rod binding domain-containing protein